MKNRKNYLLVIFFILGFGFIFSVNNFVFNLQGNNEDTNISPLLSSSDSVEFEWYATWGGIYSDGSGMITTDSSGNIYVGGATGSGTGNTDMVLIKYDSSGTELWSRTWDGSQKDDLISGIMLDPTEDNIYIAGTTVVISGWDNDMVLVKYDSSGTELWSRTWDGYDDWDCGWRPGIDDDRAQNMVVDPSGNVFLGGHTLGEHTPRWDPNPDMALVKYDSSGTQLWNRTWGGAYVEYGYGLALDSLNSVYISGSTVSFAVGSTDIFLVKYDSQGNYQWHTMWGGIYSDGSGMITTDSSGNIYVGGATGSGTGNTDMVLIKYDSSGTELWSRTWDGSQKDDLISGIMLDPTEDNIYIAGTTVVISGWDNDMVLVKYDSSGTELWSRTWDGYDDWDCGWRPGIDDDRAQNMVVDPSGNVFLGGHTLGEHTPRWDPNPDMALVKYDSSGTQLWNRTWGGAYVEYGYGLALDSLNSVYISGSTVSFAVGSTDIFLVKYIPTPPISAVVDIDPNTLNLKSNGEYITVYLELSAVYDINNIDIGSIRLKFETHEILVDIEAPITIGDYDSDGIPDLMVKFSRTEVKTRLAVPDYDSGTENGNNIEFVVTGDVLGNSFEGSDWIKVIRPDK